MGHFDTDKMDFVKSIPQPVQLAFAGVGALYIASRVLSYAQLLLNLFVLSGTDLRKYGRPGSWAVVTGASDGLGKEYAKQLAAKGFNLVLVSRTQSKLEALAQEFKVETKILAMVRHLSHWSLTYLPADPVRIIPRTMHPTTTASLSLLRDSTSLSSSTMLASLTAFLSPSLRQTRRSCRISSPSTAWEH